jgi:hypothetical protein
MKFKVMQEIVEGDLIGIDVSRKQIIRVMDDETFFSLQQRNAIMTNAIDDYREFQRIDFNITDDKNKMESTSACIEQIKHIYIAMPDGPEKENFKRKIDLIKKK